MVHLWVYMPDLKRTTYDRDHYHVVYIRDDGTGITSPDPENGHTHDVRIVPAQEALIDQVTGETVQEAREERIEVLTSNGHSHNVIELIDEVKPDPVVEGKDEELVNDVRVLHKQSLLIERDFRERGKLCVDFYNGNQWEAEAARKLEKMKRACITVNEIKPIVLVLSGHQRQNRTDIKTFPIEDADPRGAEIANVVIKYILDKTNFAQHESKVFLDQVKVGRGCFDVYVTFDESSEGDIKIVRYKWDNIYFGPHEYEDISDLEYLVKAKWYSLAKLKGMYPDKADELQHDMEMYEQDHPSISEDVQGDAYESANKITRYDQSNELLVNIQKKSFKLLELWRKRYNEVKVLVNISDPYNEFVYERSAALSDEDFKKASSIQGMEVRNVPDWQMEVVTIAGSTMLEKRVSRLKDFNAIPVYASKEDDYVEGKVEPLIDLQKEINKRTSQAIDVVNNSNNDGWFFDSETFASEKEQKKFIESANTPGWAIEIRDVSRKPEKIERGRFPQELVNMRELASAKMREIAGVTNEVLGLESNAKSGVAIARRLRQGLTVNDYLFDNLSLAKKKLGRILIKMVQDVFTVDRIMKILHDRNAVESFQVTDQNGEKVDFSDIDKDVVRRFLENVDFTKYDVSISESANSPTKNLDRFLTLTELMSTGALNEISIDLAKQAGIVSPSDAEKYKQMLRQQAEAQAQAQERDHQAQNARTLIAQGINPQTGEPLPRTE